MKVLFVGEAVSLAHVGRPVALASWTRELGFESVFSCGEKYAAIAANAGLRTVPLATIPSGTFYDRLRSGKFFYNDNDVETYVRSECEVIKEVRPDLIVSDFRLTLSISARICEVPLLVLNHAHWSPASSCLFAPPDQGSPITRSFLWPLMRRIGYRIFASPIDRARKRYGFKAHHDFRKTYTDGDWCAYLDLPELNPLPQLPPRHFYLGPLAWTPNRSEVPTDFPIVTQRGKQPLVYITVGSSGDKSRMLQIINGIRDAGCVGIVSGLSKVEINELTACIPGCHTFIEFHEMVNPEHFIQKTVLTICHGGAGTVYQILEQGVPLLCLPSNPDQDLISTQVEMQGAGIKLPARSVTSTRIAALTRKLISQERFASQASMFEMAIKSFSTQKRWAEFLLHGQPATTRTDGPATRSCETLFRSKQLNSRSE